MNTTRRPRLLTLFLMALLPAALSPARAAILTFEDIPGLGAPVDGMTVNTQFTQDYGVTFSLEGGGAAPFLARVGGVLGDPLTAFTGYDDGVHSVADQPAPGVDAGQFFLHARAPIPLTVPWAIIATYTQPMSSVSGIILDIDRTERWQVQARDSSGLIVLDFEDLDLDSDGSTVNGSSTPWSFDRLGVADIYSIRFLYTGPAELAPGFAIDNLSTPIPEPASALLLLPALLLSGRRRLHFPAVTTP